MKECTFKPKINTNVQVPAEKSMFGKPSYLKRFNEKRNSAINATYQGADSPKGGVFKNYSAAALQKAKANKAVKLVVTRPQTQKAAETQGQKFSGSRSPKKGAK